MQKVGYLKADEQPQQIPWAAEQQQQKKKKKKKQEQQADCAHQSEMCTNLAPLVVPRSAAGTKPPLMKAVVRTPPSQGSCFCGASLNGQNQQPLLRGWGQGRKGERRTWPRKG